MILFQPNQFLSQNWQLMQLENLTRETSLKYLPLVHITKMLVEKKQQWWQKTETLKDENINQEVY